MKYEKPIALIIYLEETNVITASVTGPLIPGVDTGEDKFGADD